MIAILSKASPDGANPLLSRPARAGFDIAGSNIVRRLQHSHGGQRPTERVFDRRT